MTLHPSDALRDKLLGCFLFHVSDVGGGSRLNISFGNFCNFPKMHCCMWEPVLSGLPWIVGPFCLVTHWHCLAQATRGR